MLSYVKKIPVFWLFAVPYCLLWAFLCILFQDNFRRDVLEQYFLGDQWVLACGKHPMLSAWYLNGIRFLTAESEWSPYLAVESFVLLMLWAIWQLSRNYLNDEKLALLTVLATANFRYLNIGNLVYNHNAILAVTWVLAILFLYRALSSGRWSSWIATGVWLGLGFHGKYTIAILVLTILIFMFVNRRARRHWKTAGPYLTTLVAAAIFIPHLIWLVQNDFPTFSYAFESGKKATQWFHHVRYPLSFLVGMILVLLPALITLIPIIGVAWNWKYREHLAEEADDRFRIDYLGTMIGLPLLIHLIIAVLGRSQPTSYAMALGMYVPLFFVYILSRKTDAPARRRTVILGLAIAALTMTVWSAANVINARSDNKVPYIFFQGKELARQVEDIWKRHFGDRECPFITDLDEIIWLAGNVNVYGKMKIRVHDEGITCLSSNEEMNRRGGIVLWDLNRSDKTGSDVLALFPRAQVLTEIIEIPYLPPYSPKFPPERVGIAIISPEESK